MVQFKNLDRVFEIKARNLEIGVESAVAVLAQSVGHDVVFDTPVKTGLARANWRPTKNVPSTRPTTALDPTGSTTIGRIAIVSRSYRLGDTLFIVNRVPYIGRLNAGSSPQAPAGFVGKAVDRGLVRARLLLSGGIL